MEKHENQFNSRTVQCKVMLIGKFCLENEKLVATHFYLQPTICHYPRIVGRYRIAVGRYRTGVLKLESTRSGLLRTSKISKIDPIVAKLC